MRGLAGMFGTVRWKRAATARLGNWTQAVFAGLSMGPSARESLKATGVRRSNGAGSVRSSKPTPARFQQEKNPARLPFLASHITWKRAALFQWPLLFKKALSMLEGRNRGGAVSDKADRLSASC